jgi:Protein of unknown function (DUF1761)
LKGSRAALFLFKISIFYFNKTCKMDTTFFSQLNWPAVAVATVAYFMTGGLWYSKLLFGNTWIKSTGIDMSNPEAKKGVGGVMAITFLLEFIICLALAILAYRMMLTGGVLSGIKLGLFTGVCFSAVVICISYLYQGRPKALTLIDGGYHIAGNIVAAIILCVWH